MSEPTVEILLGVEFYDADSPEMIEHFDHLPAQIVFEHILSHHEPSSPLAQDWRGYVQIRDVNQSVIGMMYDILTSSLSGFKFLLTYYTALQQRIQEKTVSDEELENALAVIVEFHPSPDLPEVDPIYHLDPPASPDPEPSS